MQLAVIEFAREVCKIESANSAEFKPGGGENVIDLMESQKSQTDKGGTMRLGAYSCQILPQSSGQATKAFLAYGRECVSERHRHRYEVSNFFRRRLEDGGLVVSGTHIYSQDPSSKPDELVEIVELPTHPWFVGCQFHPEFISSPLHPHPLFVGFIRAANERAKGVSL
jgi:CTP synthase